MDAWSGGSETCNIQRNGASKRFIEQVAETVKESEKMSEALSYGSMMVPTQILSQVAIALVFALTPATGFSVFP